MDYDEHGIILLKECGNYAYNNSIAVSDDTACVTTLEDLEDHLLTDWYYEYTNVMDVYGPFERFLRGPARDYVRNEFTRPWDNFNFEISTVERYYADKRHDHDCFSALADANLHPNTLLFVFYDKDDKLRFENERKEIKRITAMDAARMFQSPAPNQLSQEIENLYDELRPPEQFYAKKCSITNRIQRLVNKVWPGMNYEVDCFGSTANGLCSSDADVDLCIIVPKSQYEQDLRQHRRNLPRLSKSVYNMHFLANRLKEIGMTHVEAIGNATVPICKFYDPRTGLNCDINTNNILGIENTQMIGVYADLDKRIRPFIGAIKHFVKQKNINSPVGGTLSSYAYVLMAIHFLMVGLEDPVIPSLQSLDVNCRSNHCRSRSNHEVLVQFNQKLIYCDTQYHDCVRIHNTMTDAYTSHFNINENHTIWYSQNADPLSELLRKFFEYYSNPNHHFVSIYDSQGNFMEYGPKHWNDYFVIQDPFLFGKNVARTCTAIGSDIIVNEFQRAAKLLRKNTQFAVICDPASKLPRNIDMESMEYRFSSIKQRKTAHSGKQNLTFDEVFLTVDERNGQVRYQQDRLEIENQALLEEKAKKEELEQQVFIEALKKASEEVQRLAEIEVKKQIKEEAEKKARIEAENKRKEELKKKKLKEAKEAALRLEQEEKAKQQALEALLKQQEEEAKRLKEQQALLKKKQEEEKLEQERKEKMEKELKNEITGKKQIQAVHKLIDKLFEKQPSNSFIGTTEPCTDMSKLLADPSMADVDIGDLVYLISQLNFMGDAIADKMDNMVQEQIKQHEYAALHKPPGVDVNTMPHKKQTSQDGGIDDKLEEYFAQLSLLDLDDPSLIDIEPVNKKDMKFEMTQVCCYVENVPQEIDSYEIYAQMAWHGNVHEISFHKQVGKLRTWLVRMSLPSGVLVGFPKFIQLGVSEKDIYNVTTPVIAK